MSFHLILSVITHVKHISPPLHRYLIALAIQETMHPPRPAQLRRFRKFLPTHRHRMRTPLMIMTSLWRVRRRRQVAFELDYLTLRRLGDARHGGQEGVRI